MEENKPNITISGSNIQNFVSGETITINSGDQIIGVVDTDDTGIRTGKKNLVERKQQQEERKSRFPSQNDEQKFPKAASPDIVKKVAEIFHEPEDFLYDMSKKGFVLVINNVDFDHLKTRDGSDVDFESLRTFFGEKVMWGDGFKPYRNLTVERMREVIKTVGNYDFRSYGAFFLIIMSHGNKYGICGTDSRPRDSVNIVNIEDDIMPVFTCSNCDSLAEKPKVFILQACRGDMDDGGFPIETDADMESPPTKFKRMIPDFSEYLLCYPCVPGYTSIRSPEYGSYFIQSLVQIFNEKYDKEDILKMLLRVNYHVSRATNSLRIKQLPSHDNRLTRMTYFHDFFVKRQAAMRDKGYL